MLPLPILPKTLGTALTREALTAKHREMRGQLRTTCVRLNTMEPRPNYSIGRNR